MSTEPDHPNAGLCGEPAAAPYIGTHARIAPDRPAVIDSASGAVLTYRELDERSNRFAQYLAATGVKRGDCVALFMENNMRFIEIVRTTRRSGLYLTAAAAWQNISTQADRYGSTRKTALPPIRRARRASATSAKSVQIRSVPITGLTWPSATSETSSPMSGANISSASDVK